MMPAGAGVNDRAAQDDKQFCSITLRHSVATWPGLGVAGVPHGANQLPTSLSTL